MAYSRTHTARIHCDALRRLWLNGTERDREQISVEIAALTNRGAWLSLSERVSHELDASKEVADV